MQLGYTLAARRDLQTIGDFIALDNRQRARSFVAELRAACRSLRTESARYPLQPQWPGVRRMPMGTYSVLYRISDGMVQVLRVLHSARDIRELTLPD